MNISISIHSLHTEGDITTSPKSTTADYFNPLPPHGGRRGTQMFVNSGIHFNPLPPHGGRPEILIQTGDLPTFQSTPSTRRETSRNPGNMEVEKFQSTPSTRRETFGSSGKYVPGKISIHSLHTEGDTGVSEQFGILQHFNPLPPHGGRRQCICNCCEKIYHFNPLPPHGGRPVKSLA